MKILFCRGSSILSHTICGVTGDDISHCALEFPDLGIIVHSNLLGINLEWSGYFRKHTTIVHEVKYTIDSLQNELNLSTMLDQYENSWYDIGALLFVGISLVLKHYLHIPMPKKNLWQTTGMFLCTEWITKYIDGKEDSMITPRQLYERIKEQ